jgi:hypothetical protein
MAPFPSLFAAAPQNQWTYGAIQSWVYNVGEVGFNIRRSWYNRVKQSVLGPEVSGSVQVFGGRFTESCLSWGIFSTVIVRERGILIRLEAIMARYGRAASKMVKSAMRRRKHGTLRSGKGGKGGVVKSRKQAIAIGLSEARKKGAKVPKKASS